MDFLKTQAILEMNVAFKDDLKRRLELIINTPFELPTLSAPVAEEAAQKRPPPPSRRYRSKPLAHGGRWARERTGPRARPRRPWGRRRRSRAGGCGRRKWPPRIRCRARASRRDRSPSAARSQSFVRPPRIASTSACAVTSASSRVRLPAEAMTSPSAHQHRADRDLSARAGRLRLLERELHERCAVAAHPRFALGAFDKRPP